MLLYCGIQMCGIGPLWPLFLAQKMKMFTSFCFKYPVSLGRHIWDDGVSKWYGWEMLSTSDIWWDFIECGAFGGRWICTNIICCGPGPQKLTLCYMCHTWGTMVIQTVMERGPLLRVTIVTLVVMVACVVFRYVCDAIYHICFWFHVNRGTSR